MAKERVKDNDYVNSMLCMMLQYSIVAQVHLLHPVST